MAACISDFLSIIIDFTSTIEYYQIVNSDDHQCSPSISIFCSAYLAVDRTLGWNRSVHNGFYCSKSFASLILSERVLLKRSHQTELIHFVEIIKIAIIKLLSVIMNLLLCTAIIQKVVYGLSVKRIQFPRGISPWLLDSKSFTSKVASLPLINHLGVLILPDAKSVIAERIYWTLFCPISLLRRLLKVMT